MLSDKIPSAFKEGAFRMAGAMKSLDRVLLAAHVNLDGDALGAMAACGDMLRGMGKSFAIYSSTGIPQHLAFLPLPCKVCQNLSQLPFEPQNAVYLDCGDVARLGRELGPLAANWPSVNIDHHLGGNGIGSIANFVDPSAAATAQLVAYVAMALDMPLRGNLADGITLGLMTDTGGFCHGNTTAEVFALCADIAAHGCDIAGIREKLQNSWTIGRVHMWGEMFSRVRLVEQCRVAICSVTLEDLRKYRCDRDDTESLVEWMRRIQGISVSAMLREEENGACKFSLRSAGEIDVRAVAASLGGGGHRNAAGGALRMPCAEAEECLARAIGEYLNSIGVKANKLACRE